MTKIHSNSPAPLVTPRPSANLLEERPTSLGVYKQLQLDNGIRCHLVEMPDAPSVSIKVSFAVGSRNEAPHEHGAAHFLEHLFFRGQPSQPDPRRLGVDIELRGGYRNAFTDAEQTQFEARFPAEHAAYAVALLSEQLRSPRISNDSVAREKGIVINEFMRGAANPFAEAYQVTIPEWIHPRSGLGHFILGVPPEIAALTPEVLQRFYRQHYIAENATIAIAGTAGALQDIAPLLNCTFGTIARGNGPTTPPDVQIRWTDPHAERLLERPLPQGGIGLRIVLPGTPQGDAEITLATVVADILGAGTTSRLPLRLREQEALVYGCGAGHQLTGNLGTLAISSEAETPKGGAQILQIVSEELHKLAQNGPSAEELQIAHIRKIVSDRQFLRDDAAVCNRILGSLQGHGTFVAPEKVQSIVGEITPEMVQKYLQDRLGKGQSLIIATGNVKPNELDRALLNLF